MGIRDLWRADVKMLRDRLQEVIDRPEIRHALFVASPSLQVGIEHWKRDPDSKKGLQAERALVRYFARMSGRSTPFGLFSGCSVGKICDEHEATTLELASRKLYRPVSRLDFDYLFALTTGLQSDPAVASQLQYRPNSSMYRVANVWHYIESRLAGAGRTHHSVKIESDQFLDAVLDRATSGATVLELAEVVCRQPDSSDISEEDAAQYIRELVANNVLVSSLTPRVTGDALDDIIAQVESLPSLNDTAQTLKSVRKAMIELDREGVGIALDRYRAVASQLEILPAKVDPSRVYQVDMTKPVQGTVLSKLIIDEITNGIEALCRVSKNVEPEPLRLFREAFSERYDRAAVPLLEAIDDEVGVGFGEPARDSSPLLRGLRLDARGSGVAGGPGNFDGFHSVLVRKLLELAREGKQELLLDAADLPSNQNAAQFLPNSFAVNATLIATSVDHIQTGDFEILLRGIVGPCGARFFGRFCHTDPDLDCFVRSYVRKEDAHDPDGIYAEIVHLPEGRIGNVLSRPVLRQYELVYLGRSGAPLEQQIPVSDLLVYVENGQIVLYSQRIGCRVIPRLTNAHGFMNPKLSSVYRFLCSLQHQHGVSAPNFGWGPLEALDYLPRIRIGRTVLASARWRLTNKEVEAVADQEGSRRFLLMQELRQQRGLPRWVLFEESDHNLPVDLDNPLSVDALVHVLKRGSHAIVREMYPSSEQLCVTGPEGRFHHELNVPFCRRPKAKTDVKDVKLLRLSLATAYSRDARALAPGSEWLYVKLYGGIISLDEVLTTVIPSFLPKVLQDGIVRRWFFVRYSDPKPHLRLRFNGDSDSLGRELLPIISHAFNALHASGRLWKINYDTYDREIERYGGVEGTLCAEDIFYADSAAILEILQEFDGDRGLDHRWRIPLLGIDCMLSDFGLDLEAKFNMLKRLRPVDRMKRTLGEKFREQRRSLEALFDPSSEVSVPFDVARKAFQRRSARIVHAVRKLKSLQESGRLHVQILDLIPSYVHMHVNRLVRSSPNQHEIVLYDFLFRLYDSQLARERCQSQAGEHIE